eukprot:Awhi_evm1s9415
MEAIEMLSKAISKENSLTDKDKLSFYHYVGILYSDLGLRRKAAFYNRQLTQLMSKGSLYLHFETFNYRSFILFILDV